MHCPMLCIWGVFKKWEEPWPFTFPASPVPYSHWTKTSANVLSLSPENAIAKLELHDMLMQDRTYLCKRVLPTLLEFDEIANFAAPDEMLRQDGMFLCSELLPKFVERGHFQPGPAK